MTAKLLNAEEIALRLAVKPATVRLWLRKGKLKGFKAGERVWRVSETELSRFLAENTYITNEQDGCDIVKEVEVEVIETELVEKIVESLESLSMSGKIQVMQLIRDLRIKELSSTEVEEEPSYMRIREVLKNFKGSLSDEILKERENQL